jgi:hypothetical protein
MAANYLKIAWRGLPLAGLALALAASWLKAPTAAVILPVIELAVLMGVVFACVHHADVIAHRTGEPYGTLVLTIAVTVIEVALILSIMLAGEGRPTLARETVFAVIMIVCNGVVGLCLVLGGLRYGEQGFRLPGTSAYLVVLMPLATLTLILPTYTSSVPGPFYTPAQLGFVALATLALYGVFLYVQTVRHRDYFLSDLGGASDEHGARPAAWQVWESVLLLIIGLVAVVLLAKAVAGSIEVAVTSVGRAERGGRPPGGAVGAAARDHGRARCRPPQRAAEEPEPGVGIVAGDHRTYHSCRQHAGPAAEGAGGTRHRPARYRAAGADLCRQHRHLRRRPHEHPAGLCPYGAVRNLRLLRFHSMN